MSFQEITLSLEGHLARLTLNQPDKANALSQGMIAELSQALEEIAASQARVVILSGAGKHFCAGHKMDEMIGRDPVTYREIFANCTAMMRRLRELPQPVIAAVQGVATAAGCQLVAASDLAVAAASARFATPGVKIGLFCATPAVPLVRAVGTKHALEMLLTGRWVNAPEAAAWGLVNQVVPVEELPSAAERLARQIAAASPLTLALGKKVFYQQAGRPEPEAYALANQAMPLNLAMDDAQEGIKAFLAKRQPAWRGR